jgi:thiamine transporter ThiT
MVVVMVMVIVWRLGCTAGDITGDLPDIANIILGPYAAQAHASSTLFDF